MAAASILALTGFFFTSTWLGEHSSDTDCYREAVNIDITAPSEVLGPECSGDEFDEVRDEIERIRNAGGDQDVPTSPTEAEAWLITWIMLVSAGVALSLASVPLTIGIVRQFTGIDRPCWIAGLVAVAMLLVFVRAVLAQPDRFSSFSGLHEEAVDWIVFVSVFIGASPAVGLVAMAWYLYRRSDPLELGEVETIGAIIRRLVALLGTLLSLGVLSTGSRWKMIEFLPGGDTLPSVAILLYGGLFTLAAAIAYVPTQRRFVYHKEKSISHVVCGNLETRQSSRELSQPVLERKRALRAELAYSESMLGPVPASLAVLGPVLAGAIGSIFA